jgi:hypothetical protein
MARPILPAFSVCSLTSNTLLCPYPNTGNKLRRNNPDEFDSAILAACASAENCAIINTKNYIVKEGFSRRKRKEMCHTKIGAAPQSMGRPQSHIALLRRAVVNILTTASA